MVSCFAVVLLAKELNFVCSRALVRGALSEFQCCSVRFSCPCCSTFALSGSGRVLGRSRDWMLVTVVDLAALDVALMEVILVRVRNKAIQKTEE